MGQILRAGPLRVLYEDGDLRYVKLGEREVLRRVYVAVRDHNWGTVAAQLRDVQIEEGEDWFRVTYTAEHKRNDIHFEWRAVISGDAQGTIRFSMDGEALSTFMRNRIGFCVLHPVRECAGVPCVVEQVDGTRIESEFPYFISPHQPFFEMRAITHEVIAGEEEGVWAEVRFAGDIFEMEDQRNWTDASYKTYCTPLRLKYPVQIQQSEKVVQEVSLTLVGSGVSKLVGEKGSENDGNVVEVVVGEGLEREMPPLGVGIASHGERLSEKDIRRLQALGLHHVRVDVDVSREDYTEGLPLADEEAQQLGVNLEVAFHVSDEAEKELAGVVEVLRGLSSAVGIFFVFHKGEKSTSERWVAVARQQLAEFLGQGKALLGSGTNAYFTELNRGRPAVEQLDVVGYSINPQVHAFDNASLVETLEAQAETLKSAREFVGERAIVVTPVTLRPRFNPDATGPEPALAPGELPPQVDARQKTLFGAAWTLGSIKYLAEYGAASVNYYETTGWRGVMEGDRVFPLYHVIADVNEFVGGRIVRVESSRTLEVEGFALEKGKNVRLLLANFGNEAQRVGLKFENGLDIECKVRYLDERNVEEACTYVEEYRTQGGERKRIEAGSLEIELLATGIVCIDFEREV